MNKASSFGLLHVFKANISDLNLSYKIMISFILIAFIPILILGAFYYYKMNEIILNQNKANIISDLKQISQNMENNLQVCAQASQALCSNKEVDSFLTATYKDEEDSYDAYITQLKPAVQTILLNHKMVDDIYIYTKNSTFNYPVYNLLPVNSGNKDSEYVSQALLHKLFWKSTDNEGGKYIFSLYRSMNYFNINNPPGVLRLDISEDYLRQLFSGQSATRDYLVIDPQGKVVTSSDRSLLSGNLKNEEYIAAILKKGNGSGDFYMSLKGKNHLIAYRALKNQWVVISIINSDHLIEGTKKILDLMLVICSLILVILFFTARFLTRRLTARINTSVTKMHELEAGNNIVLPESGDEIGVLNKSINTMVRKLNSMINEVYVTNLQKKEAQIEALQSQIDPHFLFNSLESIRMGAVENGDRETAGMIKILAKLFRIKLNFYDNILPLEKELKIVDDYMKLQIYRFGKRLSYSNNIDDKYLSYTLPKLTIQPLVENAIVHGIERMEYGGCVTLNATEDEEFFRIIVSDNGAGIQEESLQALNRSLESDGVPYNGRIGITSVHKRLRLYYGDCYGLKIYSDGQKGTAVEIYLPREGSHV